MSVKNQDSRNQENYNFIKNLKACELEKVRSGNFLQPAKLLAIPIDKKNLTKN